MQSFLAKTLAERTVASTEGDTHEVLRSVLVDQFYGASFGHTTVYSPKRWRKKKNAFATPNRASERRQVESARRASAGRRRASSDSRRGWGRKHQFVAFYFPRVKSLSSSTQPNALHYTARLWCAFTTQSMAIAYYASSREPKPKVTVGFFSCCSVIVDYSFLH